MTSFVAIYRGQTVAEAKLIAVSAEPELVADVSSRMLQRKPDRDADAAVNCVDAGRRKALRLINQEAVDER